MQLMRYQEPMLGGFRSALVASEGRKWMQVVVIEGGKLKMIKRLLTEKDHMVPMAWNRKSKASMRQMARRRGTARNVRAAVKEIG
jgi:hypothetical protein